MGDIRTHTCHLQLCYSLRVYGMAIWTSPGSLLEIQNRRPHPRPTGSDSEFQQDVQALPRHVPVWEALLGRNGYNCVPLNWVREKSVESHENKTRIWQQQTNLKSQPFRVLSLKVEPLHGNRQTAWSLEKRNPRNNVFPTSSALIDKQGTLTYERSHLLAEHQSWEPHIIPSESNFMFSMHSSDYTLTYHLK